MNTIENVPDNPVAATGSTIIPDQAGHSGSSDGSVSEWRESLRVLPPISEYGQESLPCAVGHGIRHMSVILIDRDRRREFWSDSGILLGYCSWPKTLADDREWTRIAGG